MLWTPKNSKTHWCAALEELLPEPKERSATWLTSTFPTGSDHPDAPLCSAGYQVHTATPASVKCKGAALQVSCLACRLM